MFDCSSHTCQRNIILNRIAWLILGLALMLFTGCSKPKHGGYGDMTIQVVGYVAREENVSEKISLVGNMAANEFVELKSEIDGVIEEIKFEEGQAVKKGDLLLKIDEKKLLAAKEQAEANLNLAQTTASRYEALVASKAVSQQEYDTAMANLKVGQASVTLIEEELKDAAIYAPFDGVMGERLVSIGQFIGKGMSLSFIVNLDPMKAEFRVSERYLSKIKEGLEIEIRVAAYPGETYKGKVYFVDPRVDELTRSALIKARVPNPEAKLKPGMFSNLDLTVNTKEDTVVIPESALITTGDETSLYVVDKDNTAHLKKVTSGIRLSGRVEITQGVVDGDTIVIEGFQKLREGAKVNVHFPEEPPTIPKTE